MREIRRDLLLLAALGALLFFPGLGSRDLWNPDEARYAEVAREMDLFGEYAVPRLNGEVYTQKPPLLFWLQILSGRLAGALGGGLGETSARLPLALSAVGAILLVFRIAERFFGRRAGWLAAAAFATCFKILWQGRFGQIDMLLTFLVTLGVWFGVRGYTEGRPRLYYLFFLCAGFATLAKGPVGLLPPLLSILAFLAVTKDRAELRGLPIAAGLLVWGAVVLAWLVPAGLSGGREYLQQIVFKQNVTRYADPWHHFQPWYYYLTVIPAEFFPWSFLLPTAIRTWWKRMEGRERQGFLFALCWMVVTVAFFSVSPAKRTVYILTMYPAMAVMVGAALDRIWREWPSDLSREHRWVTVPFALVAGVVLLIEIALPVAGRGRAEAAPLGGDRLVWQVMVVLAPLALGALWAWWEARSGRIGRAAASLAGGLGIVAVTAAVLLLPRFDIVKSTREMSGVLLHLMKPGDVYGIYPRLDSTFLFYTRKFAVNLDSEEKLREFAKRPGRIWILAQRDDLAKIDPPLNLRIVATDRDLSEGYLLMTRP